MAIAALLGFPKAVHEVELAKRAPGGTGAVLWKPWRRFHEISNTTRANA